MRGDIDAAGVEVLARVSAWARRKGGEPVLRSVSPDLAEQLELARRPRFTGAIPRPPATSRHPRPGDLAERPAAETMRRLAHAVPAHQGRTPLA